MPPDSDLQEKRPVSEASDIFGNTSLQMLRENQRLLHGRVQKELKETESVECNDVRMVCECSVGRL